MKNKNFVKRMGIMISSMVMVSFVLSACGSGSAKSDSYNGYEAAVASEEYSAGDYDYYDYAAEEASSDEVYEYKSSGSEGEEITDSDVQASSNRKLIKTVNMSVETREFDELISNISSKVRQLGGYLENSEINGNSYGYTSGRTAYMVARIPQENLDSFVTNIESQSNITNKNESAEDVTLQYSDVKSHIDSLKIEQDRLNVLLEQADSLETIIALESRLTEVRYEVESYESRLRSMDNQVTFSTVNLNISEVKEYKPEPVEDPTFGERLSEEFIESCASAFVVIQDFVIGFIAFLPKLLVLLIIFGVIGGIIFLIVKGVIKVVKKVTVNKKEKKPVTLKKAADKKKEGNAAVLLTEPPKMTDEEPKKDNN